MKWNLAFRITESQGIDRRPFTSLNDTVDAMFNTLIENGHYQRTIRSWDRVNGDWIEETQENSH